MCAVAPVCISASVSSVAAYSAVQSVARSSIISYSLRRRLWLLPTIYIVIIHHIHTLHIRTYTCLSVLMYTMLGSSYEPVKGELWRHMYVETLTQLRDRSE